MRTLNAIVGTAAALLAAFNPHFPEGRTIGSQPVGHNHIGITIAAQRFENKFPRGLPVTASANIALKNLALMGNRSLEIMSFTIDLHKNLIKMPLPI